MLVNMVVLSLFFLGISILFSIVTEPVYISINSSGVCVCSVVSNSWQPMNCSLQGSSVHGVSQARILSGLPRPLPGDLPDPGIEPSSLTSLALAGRLFTSKPPRKPHIVDVQFSSVQSLSCV